MEIRRRKTGESAQDYAYHILRDQILFCEVAPGTSLNLQELSKQLEISRTPIRDAIQRLEREQVIDVYPQSGSVVGYLNFDLASDAIFVRRSMELELIGDVCLRATEQDIKKIETSIGLQEFYLDRKLFPKMIREDNHFHQLLFSVCGRERIFSNFNIGMLHLDRIRHLRVSIIQDDKVIIEHTAILDSIKNRDPQAARQAVAAHLTEYTPEERRIMMERYPKYFHPDDLIKNHISIPA